MAKCKTFYRGSKKSVNMTNETEISASAKESPATNESSVEPVAASVEPKGRHTLWVRIVSSLVMLVVAGMAIYRGGFVFYSLVALVVAELVYEYCSLVKAKGFNPNLLLCVVCSLAIVIVESSGLKVAVAGWLDMAILAWCLFCSVLDNVFHHQERKSYIVDSAVNCFAVAYCGFLPALLCYLRSVNVFLVVFLVVICIATDVGGYFFGRTLGRSKLSPLSPGKTWAGFWGGLLLSIICIYGLLYWNMSQTIFIKYNVFFWLIMGVGCSLMGQLGDLFESSLKRDAGCKDSGTIIPGHGGLLDRFDSYLLASLFAYMWLTFCLSLPVLDSLFSF